MQAPKCNSRPSVETAKKVRKHRSDIIDDDSDWWKKERFWCELRLE